MNYIERLLESQFASDELKDYLDRKHKKGNPKQGQKFKVPVEGNKNKDVNRRAKGLQSAPNASRLAVQLNAKLRFNNLNALAEQDGKYRNLVWILATGRNIGKVFKYFTNFLELEPNKSNFEISNYQIRITDIGKKSVQQYFIRQNGIGFMKAIDKLVNDEPEQEEQPQTSTDKNPDDLEQKTDQVNQSDDETRAKDQERENQSKQEEDELSAKREKKDREKTERSKIDDPYRDDVIGYDHKKRKPVYKKYSKGWWAQRDEFAKQQGFDLSKANLDPSSWKMSQALKKAS